MKTCEEITVLYEQGKLKRLSISNRLSIRTHKSICKDCRQYFKDSDHMDDMMTKKFRDLGNYTFTSEEKEALKEKLKNS